MPSLKLADSENESFLPAVPSDYVGLISGWQILIRPMITNWTKKLGKLIDEQRWNYHHLTNYPGQWSHFPRLFKLFDYAVQQYNNKHVPSYSQLGRSWQYRVEISGSPCPAVASSVRNAFDGWEARHLPDLTSFLRALPGCTMAEEQNAASLPCLYLDQARTDMFRWQASGNVHRWSSLQPQLHRVIPSTALNLVRLHNAGRNTNWLFHDIPGRTFQHYLRPVSTFSVFQDFLGPFISKFYVFPALSNTPVSTFSVTYIWR